MELVLYYIMESSVLLISFLILTFVLGVICFLTIKKFRQDSRWKVTFYGLFFKLRDIDLIKLSSITIRTFLVIFSAVVFSKNIYVYLAMIILISLVYIILSLKRFIYELTCAIIQIITVYFIDVLNNYMLEMEYSLSLLIIENSLKVFIIIFALYFFFKNIFDIVEHSNNKKLKKSGKVID